MQFIDLGAQRERIRDRLKAAIDHVVEDGRYILGPQVTEFENKLAALLARDMGAQLSYVWWAQRRGYARHTLRLNGTIAAQNAGLSPLEQANKALGV